MWAWLLMRVCLWVGCTYVSGLVCFTPTLQRKHPLIPAHTHTHMSAELSRLVIVLCDLMTLRLRPPLPLSLPRCIRRFIRRVLHS